MSKAVAIRRDSRPRRSGPRSARVLSARERPISASAELWAMTPALIRRLIWGFAGALTLSAAGLGLWLLGVPQAIVWNAGEGIGELGLRVKHVEVTGIKASARLPIYATVLDQPSTAMPLIDLGEVRRRLQAQPWVADAQVSRRLPDTIAVNVVERVPAALWQVNGEVRLIDAGGVPMQVVAPDAYPKLPLVVGPGANMHADALKSLLAQTPALQAEVDDAVWVGGRRWNLHFTSGEVLALPEGDAAARRALALFARLDGSTGLLKRGFVRFDMRLPDKMVVRVSNEPGREAAPVDEATKI